MPTGPSRRWHYCVAAAFLVSACGTTSMPPDQGALARSPLPSVGATAITASPSTFTAQVVSELPHDPSAFTQGWELLPDDQTKVLESTGGYGSSTVRINDLATGKALRKVTVPTSTQWVRPWSRTSGSGS